ncbi:MAG: FlgD immunoglobulin-like domain containing protein [Gaiellaceae bacterium]
MPRVFSAALLLVLLASTALAFVVTEGLKLEPSPITSVSVDKVVSPTCACPTSHATIRFRLREADRVTISIVDAAGREVRVLVHAQPRKKGFVHVRWNGRGTGGALPDGLYRPRVHLRNQHKTITLPNPISVDTTPPVFKSVHVRPHIVAPGKHAAVIYRLDGPARVTVFANGKQVVVGRASKPSWKLNWYAERTRPGTYRLTVVAVDAAGNRSATRRAGTVLIPLHVSVKRVRTTAGASFAVGLATDGRAYHWNFAGAEGVSRAQRLVLQAPAQAGRYTVVIRQDKLAHRVAVVVK